MELYKSSIELHRTLWRIPMELQRKKLYVATYANFYGEISMKFFIGIFFYNYTLLRALNCFLWAKSLCGHMRLYI
jgi:hypothetical protein